MWLAIVDGLGLGLLLTVLIGPVFFLLIKTSLEQGAKQALVLDIGVLIGDLLIIYLAYVGLAKYFEIPFFAKWIGIFGSFILIGFGIFPFFQKANNKKELEVFDAKNFAILISKGFFLNVTNPFVYFFWIGSLGYAVTTFDAKLQLIVVYFLSCLACYFTLDLFKIYAAIRIKKSLTPKLILTINKLASAGVVILGISLLWRIIEKYGL